MKKTDNFSEYAYKYPLYGLSLTNKHKQENTHATVMFTYHRMVAMHSHIRIRLWMRGGHLSKAIIHIFCIPCSFNDYVNHLLNIVNIKTMHHKDIYIFFKSERGPLIGANFFKHVRFVWAFRSSFIFILTITEYLKIFIYFPSVNYSKFIIFILFPSLYIIKKKN